MNFGNNFNNGGFGGGFGGGFSTGGGFGGFDSTFSDASQLPLNTYNFGQPQLESNASQTGVFSIEIRKLYMGKTRPQANQHRRSYDVVLDGTGHTAIQNQVEQLGAEAFKPMNMGKLFASGAEFIRPSGMPDHEVGIANGWEQERFRFTMVVDVFRNGKFNRTEFVSGYTDTPEVTGFGMTKVNVDPQMVFTINHITEARMRQLDSFGRPIPMISRANVVVRNGQFVNQGIGATDPLYLTRPSDVLRAVDKVDLYNGMRQAQQLEDYSSQQYMDLDSTLTGVPLMSADTNMLIPTFASRTLKTLYENSMSKYDPLNMDGTSAGQVSSELTKDTPFTQSGFALVMQRKLGNYVTSTAQFTYGDLLRLDPTIDDRAEVFGRSYDQGAIVIPDGREVWNLAEANTVALHATSIAHTTLSLMSLAGVATLAYHADNMMSGKTEVTFQACDGMDNDGLLGMRLEQLKNRLIVECLNIMSRESIDFGPTQDTVTYELDVFADAYNDVYIQLTWDGVQRSYVIPAFASSALVPVVTKDINRLTGMAESISQVVKTCRQILHPNAHFEDDDNVIEGNGTGRVGGLAGDY